MDVRNISLHRVTGYQDRGSLFGHSIPDSMELRRSSLLCIHEVQGGGGACSRSHHVDLVWKIEAKDLFADSYQPVYTSQRFGSSCSGTCALPFEIDLHLLRAINGKFRMV